MNRPRPPGGKRDRHGNKIREPKRDKVDCPPWTPCRDCSYFHHQQICARKLIYEAERDKCQYDAWAVSWDRHVNATHGAFNQGGQFLADRFATAIQLMQANAERQRDRRESRPTGHRPCNRLFKLQPARPRPVQMQGHATSRTMMRTRTTAIDRTRDRSWSSNTSQVIRPQSSGLRTGNC